MHDTGKPCAACIAEDTPALETQPTPPAVITEATEATEPTGPHLVTKSFAGVNFFVVDPPSIGYPGHSTVCFDEHEPVHHLVGELGPGDLLIDIGAQFGSYALPALVMGASVIAFEPTEYASESMKASVEVNGWQDRCTVVRMALYDGTAYPEALTSEVFGQHYPSAGHEVSTLDGELEHAKVDCKRMVIKIDVEGAELGVLRGAIKTLKAFKPTLIVEDHDGINPGVGCAVSDYPASIDSAKKIHKMLKGLGYDIEVVPFDVSRKYIVARPKAA